MNRTMACCFAMAVIVFPVAATADQGCHLEGAWPPQLTFDSAATDETMAADFVDGNGRVFGRQVVFGRDDSSPVPVITRELFFKAEKPKVRCAPEKDANLTTLTHVDVGPEVKVKGLYQETGAVTVSFYAYERDFFKGRNDEGLANQLFFVQLDNRPATQVEVTAKPGQDVTVRFDGVAPGTHEIRFAEMEPSREGYALTWLSALSFTQIHFDGDPFGTDR